MINKLFNKLWNIALIIILCGFILSLSNIFIFNGNKTLNVIVTVMMVTGNIFFIISLITVILRLNKELKNLKEKTKK